VIEYLHFHFALIRVIASQISFPPCSLQCFLKYMGKCSTYTPSHRGATAAPSALCDIRLFLPRRNEYYDSVISASHSNNDVKHAREVRSLPGEMFDEQSPLLQANTPAVVHITPSVCAGYVSLPIRRPARITMRGQTKDQTSPHGQPA